MVKSAQVVLDQLPDPRDVERNNGVKVVGGDCYLADVFKDNQVRNGEGEEAEDLEERVDVHG